MEADNSVQTIAGDGYFGSSKCTSCCSGLVLTDSSAPIVGTSIVVLFFTMPSPNIDKTIRDRFRGFDGIGGVLSVCWPIPLLFALQEAGVQYEWKSGVIIGTLVAGIILFILFGLYECVISYKTKIDAMLPLRLLKNPSLAWQLLSVGLLGMPMYVAFIQLPQRFQSVNFTSAERAGILLLPVSLLTPLGATVFGILFGKKIMGTPIATEYLLLLSTVILSIGIGLLSSLPIDSHISNASYGYEIIVGFGIGFAGAPYFPLLYTCVEEKDVAVAIGIMNMLRTLGGAIAVAICSALHHSMLQKKLAGFLDPMQITAVEQSVASIAQLPEEQRTMLGRVFGQSYNRQFQVTLAFSLLNVLVVVTLIVTRKRQGIFGVIPTRKEENEFMKKVPAEEKAETDSKEAPLGAPSRLSDGTPAVAVAPNEGDNRRISN